MILKVVGLMFVFGSTAFAGMYYGNLDTFRLGHLCEMKKALSILRAEIEFAHTPLPEVLRNIGGRTKAPIANIFMALEQSLHTERGANVGTLWNQSITEMAPQTYFNKEDIDQLISFGQTLGYLDTGMQVSNIAILHEYINEKTQGLNQSRFKNKRLFQSLGFLGGILMIVIFI